MSAIGRIGAVGRLGLVAAAARQPFDPRLEFFSAGEQGVWYDPSDLSTLFQDSAGTTPVTAVEQPVGLMLDKSKGLVLGPELVAPLDLRTGWNVTGTVLDENSFTTTGIGGVWKDVFTAGSTYKITVAGNTTGGVEFRTWDGVTQVVRLSGFGSAIFTVPPGQTRLYIRHATAGTTNIDNISVRELPGNHAFQSTAIDRPILRNRYNLLTKTEQFDDAVWLKQGGAGSTGVVTADAGVAPDGVSTADRVVLTSAGNFALIQQAITVPANFSRVVSIWVRSNTGVSQTFSFGDDQVGLTSITATTSWQRFTASVSFSGTTAKIQLVVFGSSTRDLLIYGASLVPADQASLPYQRVNTATDYDSDPSKFPLYLSANGVNTWMQTNPIDFSATDKVTVFAGVRKLSDAARGVVFELSTSAVSNAGAFSLEAPATALNNYLAISRGTALSSIAAVRIAPTTNIVSVLASIVDDLLQVRIDAGVAAATGLDQGVGNYGNYPMFLFRRAGTSLPFNGQFHGLLISGALHADSKNAAMERWLAPKTGVTL